MNLQGLIGRMRAEFLSDDTGTSELDYLFKTPAIVAALVQAERELARRLYLISDSTTAEICHLSVAAVLGVFPRTYALDDRILRIERLKFPGVTQPLIRTTTTKLDEQDPGWDELKGTPTHFVADMESFSVTFNRQPLAGGTAVLHVKRLPLVRLTTKTPNSSFEIKQLDDELIHGALKYLYLRPDIEGYDAALARKWEVKFEEDIDTITQNKAAMNPQEYICRPERF